MARLCAPKGVCIPPASFGLPRHSAPRAPFVYQARHERIARSTERSDGRIPNNEVRSSPLVGFFRPLIPPRAHHCLPSAARAVGEVGFAVVECILPPPREGGRGVGHSKNFFKNPVIHPAEILAYVVQSKCEKQEEKKHEKSERKNRGSNQKAGRRAKNYPSPRARSSPYGGTARPRGGIKGKNNIKTLTITRPSGTIKTQNFRRNAT